MRRAFTLIEILTVVAIISIMVTAGVVSVRAGQGAARLKAATRDIFATIRHARSVALITQQPSVITYSTQMVDGEVCAKVEIVTAKIFEDNAATTAQTLSGREVSLGGADAESASGARDAGRMTKGAKATQHEEDDAGGQSVSDILFAPISTEVVKGLRLKVTMGDEMLAESTVSDEQRKSMISAWGTASGIIESYRKTREKSDAEKNPPEGDTSDAGAADGTGESTQEPVSVVWEVNGRTEPHRIWIYRDGSAPERGLSIKVDRFGAAKVIGLGEDDE